MKRKLLKQMLNDWRANIWLVIELIIVVLVMQVVFGALYSFYQMYHRAVDVNTDEIFVANINTRQEGSDGYQPYDSLHSKSSDIEMLCVSLRSNPYVDMVGLANSNGVPYQYNFWGDGIVEVGDTARRSFNVNVRQMSPEVLEMFNITGADGESARQLGALLEKGNLIISEQEAERPEGCRKAADFRGKDVNWFSDTLTVWHVGAVAKGMRRSDYEMLFAGTGYIGIRPENASIVVIRVKPGTGRKFVETLSHEDRQSGNLYLTSLQSLEDMRSNCQMEITQIMRQFTVCALFVLGMVFMGFLGTFWFRTQQRVSEIAIRKVNGATNGDIYRRFFAEGMVLLALATMLALPVTVWYVSGISDIIGMEFSESTVAVSAVLSVMIVAAMIIAGIYAPARKAAAVSPAEALKDM